MTKESATLELIAARIEQILEGIGHIRADVREMHAVMDAIEGHLRPLDEILEQASGGGVGDRETG